MFALLEFIVELTLGLIEEGFVWLLHYMASAWDWVGETMNKIDIHPQAH